jgi:hypothetical protein
LLPRGLPKTVYASTMIALFLAANTVKLARYLWLSANDLRVLLMAAALMPAVPARRLGRQSAARPAG